MNTATPNRARKKSATLLAAGLAAITGVHASATIIGAVGAITVLPFPPPDTMPGGINESNATIFAFDEKQGDPIAGPTPVNMIGKPQTVWHNPGIQGVIVAPIDVDSHIIELDPFVGTAHLGGILRFDKPIIGVQVLRRQLDETDYLGAPPTIYPTPPIPGVVPRRGLDWDATGTEIVTILPSLHELKIDLWASNSIDHIRVLTSWQDPVYDLVDPLPVPGDTDGDGDVDDGDLATAFSNYTGPMGAAGGKYPWEGDTDGDGDVDDADLANLLGGFTGPTAAPAAVPEPGAMALICLGGCLLLRRRRPEHPG